MNTVRNNIFAFSDEHIIRISRDELHMSTIFENNILYSSGAPMYNLKSNHVLRKSTASQRNIMYDCKNEVPIICQYLDKSLSMDEFQKYGFENESIIADPLFVDATGYNFRLKPESPAFALGFKEIDISDAGPIR